MSSDLRDAWKSSLPASSLSRSVGGSTTKFPSLPTSRQLGALLALRSQPKVPACLSGSSGGTSSKEGLLSASWLLSSCSLRSWWLGSGRVILQLSLGVVGFAIDGIVDARGKRSSSSSVVAWSGVSSSSLPSSSTCLKRRAVMGVTVASKSLSLSLSWYFGDVNSCLWLVKLAHALDAVIEHNLYFVFEGGR